MKNLKFHSLLSVAVLSSLAACSSAPPKKVEAPAKTDAKAATAAPAAVQAPNRANTFKLRPIREVHLENGLKLLFIADNSLPRVSMTALVRVGVRQDPKDKEGLNYITANLLEQGTQTKNAMALADELGQLGTELSVEPGNDFTVINMDGLSSTADKLLATYADILLNPAFTDAEVARIKAQTVAQIKKKIDDPSSFAGDLFDAYLFAGHPYASDVRGNEKSIRKLTKQDVIRHYLTYYRPNNTAIAVVGRYNKDFEAKVTEAFQKWAGKPIRDFQSPELKPIAATEVKVMSKAGLQQAQIRFGEMAIPRNHPDYLKLRLANVALGGEFGSRLNQHVRDDLGLTYSIYSYLDARADKGSFVISTFTKNETIGKTVDETLKVLNEFMEKGMTESEMNAAKNQLIGQFPRVIETADRMAYNILALDFYGVPLSYLQDFNKNVEAMSLSDVNDTLKKNLSGTKVKVLVYADDKKVGDQLKTYNPTIEKVR